MTSREKQLRRLRKAADAQQLVRIERRSGIVDRVDGFVVGIGRKWLLVQSTGDGGHFDALVAIRLRDARRLPDITLPAVEAGDAAWAAWRERVHARSTVVMADEKQRLLALGLIDEHWKPLTNELPEDMLPSSKTSVET